MATMRYTVGDHLPALRRVLSDADGPIDLTGATVTFSMASRAGGAKVTKAAVTIDDPSAGSVSYAWAASDLDTPGSFDAEFEITFGSGKILTVPNAGHDLVVVQSAVA